MRKVTLLSVLLCVLFLGAANEQTSYVKKSNEYYKPSDKTVQKEFNVNPGGKINLDLQIGGAIEVKGWDKNVVSVKADISGRDADDINVDMDQNGDEITVTSYYDGYRNDNHSRQKIMVYVPVKFNVEFSTMGGDVDLDNVNGEMQGKTMGGELNLTNLKGNVQMTTMGGKIEVRDCEVDGKVKTMGGQVLVENVTGDLDASSMGGKVIQRNVKGKKGSSGKEVNISTMGGAIDVDSAPNGTKVKTMGGDITINSASKFVEAVTYGGTIEIKEVDGSVKAQTYGGDVDVNEIGTGDGKDIDISSLGGDITLTVPSGFSMDVYVEVAYTKDWSRKHMDIEDASVEGDFKLDQKKSDDWEYKHGSPRKYLHGTGTFNGGKNKVTIKTINGTVTLKKS